MDEFWMMVWKLGPFFFVAWLFGFACGAVASLMDLGVRGKSRGKTDVKPLTSQDKYLE